MSYFYIPACSINFSCNLNFLNNDENAIRYYTIYSERHKFIKKRIEYFNEIQKEYNIDNKFFDINENLHQHFIGNITTITDLNQLLIINELFHILLVNNNNSVFYVNNINIDNKDITYFLEGLLCKFTIVNIESESFKLDMRLKNNCMFFLDKKKDKFQSLMENVSFLFNNIFENIVLEIYEDYDYSVVELIYLVASLFKKVHLYKPNVCDILNNDLYLVCIGRKDVNNKEVETFIKTFKASKCNNNEKTVKSISLPLFFMNKINDISLIYYQSKLEFINNSINYIIRNKSKENSFYLIKNKLKRLNTWLEKYSNSRENHQLTV